MRVVVSFLLLAVLGFSLFGFRATFEPHGEGGGGFVAWRWFYGAAAALCVAGLVTLFARRRSVPG